MNKMGIIFDFNGTLFFDSDKQEKAWIIISALYRKKPFSNEEMETKVHGINNRDTFEYLLDRKVSKEELNELIAKKEKIYRKLCLEDINNFKLVDGAIELFEFLKDNSIPFTIATASGLENLKFFIKNFKLDKWFDIDKIIYDDGTIIGKPNPDIYLKAIKKLGIEAGNCIVVEDALSGIEAAKLAKVGKIIAITSKENINKFKTIECIAEVITDFKEFKIN